MSGQRDITLRSGHATPSTIVLRALPVATASTTTIYLYEGDATPSTIILRDPTTLAATGGAQSYTLTATPATLTLAGAVAALTVARRLTALPGALVLTGAEATLRVWRTLTALPGALTLTGAAAMLDYVPGTAPAVPDTHDGAGWIKRPERDLRPLERDELRAMLEAAFADAPSDPVVVEARREHRLEATDATDPRVDWSRMLADLTACAAVLARYTERIDSGRARIQQGEAAREDLPYSSDSIDQMIASVRAEIAAKKARKRREALLLLLS